MDTKRDQIEKTILTLRKQLEGVFSEDTSAEGFASSTPSSGHCAAVAVIVHETLGGILLSTLVDGSSHWFNRLDQGAQRIDVDITGDQFGYPPVQIAPEGCLYSDVRERRFRELKTETLLRARLLARHAELGPAEKTIGAELERRENTALSVA